jgi:hypothetical protein
MEDVTQCRLGDTKKFGLHNTILPPKNADNRAGFHGFFSLLLLSMTLLMLCHGDVTHLCPFLVAYSVRAICTLCTESAVQWSTNYGPEGKQGDFFDQCVFKLLYMAEAPFCKKNVWNNKFYVIYLINVIVEFLDTHLRSHWLCMGS